MCKCRKTHIHPALRYVHFWESHDRGKERLSREYAVEFAIELFALTGTEESILRSATHTAKNGVKS